MEGVNAYAITSFSDWKGLGTQIRTEFEFGKQRSTAYTRWVVERSLVAKFVDTYVDAVVDLRVGHPFLGHPFLGHPIDFGPLISAGRADALRRDIDRATATGALVLYQGQMYEDDFELGQDRRAYLAPTLLYGVRPPAELYHREPFGPVDILVSVGSDDELIAEANVAGGALVASIATDEPARATALSGRLDAFKIGINRLRSRGDKEEPVGGTGGSWEGAFVGGVHLVRAFTEGSVKPDGRWPAAF
jgi:acyl-CoA reductase-like NAD-dependent aldehyde dehydrogenase